MEKEGYITPHTPDARCALCKFDREFVIQLVDGYIRMYGPLVYCSREEAINLLSERDWKSTEELFRTVQLIFTEGGENT